MTITTEAVNIAQNCIRKEPMPKSLAKQVCANNMEHLMHDVYFRTAALIQDNAATFPEKQRHLAQILPCIAFFQALVDETGSREKALDLYGKWCLLEVEKMAKWLPALLKVPGLYRLAPKVMKKLLDTTFGEKAGFQSRNPSTKGGFSVEMTACPYVEMCRKYGCMEIAPFFCKSDDLCFGHMHPKLLWLRTKTLGCGDACCDFKLLINE